MFVDRRNMEEVFSNLISNAINYTPDVKVTVAAALEGGYLRASVSDNGIGMAPEDLSQIFNRFYRIKTDKTRSIIAPVWDWPSSKASWKPTTALSAWRVSLTAGVHSTSTSPAPDHNDRLPERRSAGF